MSSSDTSATNTYSLNLLSMPLLQVVSNSSQSAASATVNAISNKLKGNKDAETSVTIAPPRPQPNNCEPAAAPAPDNFHAISRSDTDDSIVSEASDDAAPEPLTDSFESGTEGEAEFQQPAPAYSAVVDANMMHGIPDSKSAPPTNSIVDRSENAAPMPVVEHGAGLETGYSSF